MSYTALCKKWDRDFKKKWKSEELARKKKKEEDLKRSEDHFFACIREEKRLVEQAQKDKEIFINEANSFLYIVAKDYNYKMYLIAWDIVHHDYTQIKANITKGRITDQEVQEIYNLACSHFSKLNFQWNIAM